MKHLIRRSLALLLAAALSAGLCAPAAAAASGGSTSTPTLSITFHTGGTDVASGGELPVPSGSTFSLTATFALTGVSLNNGETLNITSAAWTWKSGDGQYITVGSPTNDLAAQTSTVDVTAAAGIYKNQDLGASVTAEVEVTYEVVSSSGGTTTGGTTSGGTTSGGTTSGGTTSGGTTSGGTTSGGTTSGGTTSGGTTSGGTTPASQTITASASVKAVVDYAVPTGVSISSTTATIEVDMQTTLRGSVRPDNADQSKLYWELAAGGDKVVNLSSTTGTSVDLTGNAPGVTTVTVRVDETSYSASCTVTVPGIVLDRSSVSMIIGASQELKATYYGVAHGTGVKWSSNNMGVVRVSESGDIATLTPVSEGTAVVTATIGSYSVTCDVTVAANTATTIFAPNLETLEPLTFDTLLTELNRVCVDTLGNPLSYISNLSVPTSQGILYYGYVSSDSTGLGVGTEQYHASPNTLMGQRGIADITFVPRATFSGTATIHYTGADRNGTSFSGTIEVKVESELDVAYVTSMGAPIQFDAADFIGVCRTRTSGSLSYVTFALPSASRGTLYYHYTDAYTYADPVTAGTQYRVNGSPNLGNITFVPNEGYSGTFVIPYIGVDSAGKSFEGSLTISVTGGASAATEIKYQANSSGTADFDAAHFNAVSLAVNGAALHYVYLGLPDSSAGTLYSNYRSGYYNTPVSADTRYYYSASAPFLSNVTFVGGAGFTDLVFIPYTAYDVNGGRFTGSICIEPSDSQGGQGSADGSLSYTAYAGLPLTFDPADLNEVCLDATGSPLSYVTFTLPPASRGALYYSYNTSNTTVSAYTRYYRSAYPYISSVSFVPAGSFAGTVGIPYTGYTADNKSFSGTIWVTVQASASTTIAYKAASGGTAAFSSAEFNVVSQRLTGSSLDYVRFTLPDATRGVLYYNTSSSIGSYASRVSAYTNYYRSSSYTYYNLLDNVSFTAADGFTGTASIPFTGWNVLGVKFTGTVEITVSDPTADAIRYTGSSLPISLRAADFTAVCRAVYGRELSYIRFTSLPDQSVGRLYLNYRSPSATGTAVYTGSSYYANGTPALGSVSFVPRADYEGPVTVGYIGADTTGATFTGQIVFTISDAYSRSSFTDMGDFGWASPAVEFLKHYTIVDGVGGTRFSPGQYMTRGDFTLMLCRAFGFNTGATENFSDVDPDMYYAWAIATAKDLGIAQGSGGLFLPRSAISRQDAMVMIQRALSAAGIALSTGSSYLLSYYADGDKVSSYARQAVATLVQANVIRGDDRSQLQPLDPIRRAEMAVILHRVLTL